MSRSEPGLADPRPGPQRRRFHRDSAADSASLPRDSAPIAFGSADPGTRAAHLAALGGLLLALLGGLAYVVVARGSGSVGSTAGAALVLALPALYGWTLLAQRSRALLRGGSMCLRNGVLEIGHPAYLEAPIEVPLEMVRAASIDERPEPNLESGLAMRFPVFERDPANPGFGLPSSYLWLKRRGSRTVESTFPQLGTQAEVPNFAVLFEQPVLLPDLKREPLGGMPQSGARGLLISVDDIAAARRLFARASMLRPLTTDDLR